MVCGFVVLIDTVMYLAFTDVGSSIIKGLHARYFYPVLIPFLLLFAKENKRNTTDKNIKCDTLLLVVPFLIIAGVCFSLLYFGIGI